MFRYFCRGNGREGKGKERSSLGGTGFPRYFSPAAAMAVVELYKLVGSRGYTLRRVRRLLPPAPRRDFVVENLIMALHLLQELADQPLPEFALDGGLPRLVSLANRPAASIVLEDAPVMKSGDRRGREDQLC